MIRAELQKKIDQSIRLLRQAQQAYPDEQIEVSYSGGKDSDVILQLAKEAGINFIPIYKNTTIDPPGTLKHVKSRGGVKIINPKKSFFELIKERGLPTRTRRFCCEVLKEYKVNNVAIQGIRRSESSKRAERYKEPQVCRTYKKNEKVKIFYPILTWTDEDVSEFIADRKIQLAPAYYNSQGEVNIKKRLGCVGCPLGYRKHRIEEFMQNPNILKGYIRSLKIYRDNHPNTAACQSFDSEYEQIVFDIFYDSMEEFKLAMNGMFDKPDCKIFLENYFKIKL